MHAHAHGVARGVGLGCLMFGGAVADVAAERAERYCAAARVAGLGVNGIRSAKSERRLEQGQRQRQRLELG